MNYKKINEHEPIRLAFLGCGGVTNKHAKTLKGFKNTELYYASRSEVKAKEYCEKWKGKGFFGSYEDAILSEKINTILTPFNY